MILQSMTSKEIRAHIDKDVDIIHPKMMTVLFNWRKTLKKFPRSRYRVEHLRCRETFQDYIGIPIHVGKDLKRGILLNYLAVVDAGTHKLYISTVSLGSLLEIHTTHFFERYRERTNRQHLTLEQAIGEFFYNTIGMSTIYNDNQGRMVVATMEGLCLCEYDDDKDPGKIYFRTFVSEDMLKYTQKGAWCVIQKDLEKLREYGTLSKRAGTPEWEDGKNDLIRSIGKFNQDVASEIYAQHFER